MSTKRDELGSLSSIVLFATDNGRLGRVTAVLAKDISELATVARYLATQPLAPAVIERMHVASERNETVVLTGAEADMLLRALGVSAPEGFNR